MAASSRFRVPSIRQAVRRLEIARPARPILGKRRQLMNDMCRTGGFDRGHQGIRVQRVGHGRGGAERAQLILFARGTGQRNDPVPCRDERPHERNTDGSGSSCNKDSHEAGLSVHTPQDDRGTQNVTGRVFLSGRYGRVLLR